VRISWKRWEKLNGAPEFSWREPMVFLTPEEVTRVYRIDLEQQKSRPALSKV
jgi:hypothetical protein